MDQKGIAIMNYQNWTVTHQNGGPDRISRHPWKKRFEARYGAELELLERLRAERSETWNAPTATAPAR